MPKREKTPPPGEDEPKYLIVHNPYPHAQLTQPGDRLQFCQWMAEAMGSTDYLYAYFDRPGSPGSVIVEISQDYPDINRLLGAHIWGKMLRDLPENDPNYPKTTSSIFFCAYTTGRQVEKHGWKRIYIKETWFGTESHRKQIFVDSYPATSFAVPPVEPYGKNLFLPLPKGRFPEIDPPPAPKPIVGTEEWVEYQTLQAAKDVIRQAGHHDDQDLAELTAPINLDSANNNDGDKPTLNFWANIEDDEPGTDLGYAGAAEGSGDNSCPWHGTSCKKGLCEWRADYEKNQELQFGRKEGGPSNIKNYRSNGNQRQDSNQSPNPWNNNNRGRGRGASSKSGRPTPNPSVVHSGRGSNTPMRGSNNPRGTLNNRPPPARTNAWSKPISPVNTNSTPNGPASPTSPTAARGNPAWAVRGRGRV